jgi:acyl transferase domain-containing protein/pimeloyl-ACP methyl ester carboxylesterase/NAD(P)-dependent dehydrogenase (short-subunit alcohol dehydrogenase family)
LLAIQKLQARVAELEQSKDQVAVVAMGCRFPQGDGPEAFWDLLARGGDAVNEIPPERWTVPPDALTATRWAALLPAASIEQFDAEFFQMSPREAAFLDPQQRLLLEVAHETLEDGGLIAPPATGVFVGIYNTDYQQRLRALGEAELDVYATTGSGLAFAAGRLAFAMGLQGPAVCVDTACSSALVAVHLACASLLRGECELALAGGCNAILSAQSMEAVARVQALSAEGRCKTFDALAGGFVRAEGCGLVALKLLSAAQRDGDRIWAVLPGSASNQDGRSNGMTAPNPVAQSALVRAALKTAGCQPSDLDLIEAHGTGTPLGDPIEIEGLRGVISTPCWVGSVKTNLGHAEAAAGIAGLLKVVLALHHQTIPRQVHFRALNPRIDLGPLRVPQAAQPWPRGERRRLAGVSSFGLSGSNAHVLVAEPPQAATTGAPAGVPAGGATGSTEESADGGADVPGRPFLLPLSARSPAALRQLARSWESLLSDGLELSDRVYTAAARRAHHPHRLTAVGHSAEDLRQALSAASTDPTLPRASGLVMVFPGQGSQWEGMGRELLRNEPVFRQAYLACQAAVAAHSVGDAQGIAAIQPAIFSMQVALAALWQSWGVVPDAVVGHSMGEVAAAHIAGALSLDDAARVICRRSRLLYRLRGRGGMALVELSVPQVEERLSAQPELSVAVSNSPRSTVVAGDRAALERWLPNLDVFWRWVDVDVASHSPQVDELRPDLLEALRDIIPGPSRLPFHSSVTCGVFDGAALTPDYWMRNLRQPVRFAETVQGLPGRRFLEVSPHPILLADLPDGSVASLRRQQPEQAALLASLGQLYRGGYSVDWKRLYPQRKVVSLPRYPWQRKRHWVDPPTTDSGARKVRLDPVQAPWLFEHRVAGAAILPAAAYLQALFQEEGCDYALRSLELGEPLVLHQRLETLQVSWAGPSFELKSGATVHLRGETGPLGSAPAAPNLEAVKSRSQSRPVDPWYDRLAQRGLSYGEPFRGVRELWVGQGEALARVRCDGPSGQSDRDLSSHQVCLLDACLQPLLALRQERPAVPVAMQRVRRFQPLPEEVFSYVTAAGDVLVFDLRGQPLLEILGLQGRDLESDSDQVLLEVRWDQAPRDQVATQEPTGSAPSSWSEAQRRWTIVPDSEGLAQRLSPSLARSDDAQATDCLFLSGLDATLENIAEICAQLAATASSLESQRLWVVTRLGALEQAPLRGLCRAIALENPRLRCTSVEWEDDVEALLAELSAGGPETALRLGAQGRQVARLQHAATPEIPRFPARGRAFAWTPQGLLPCPETPPGSEEVRIEVEVAGLNFKDALLSVGALSGFPPGSECSGRVIAVGKEMRDLQVGQRVMALAPGALASHVTVPSALVLPVPDSWSAEQAATVPVVFLTAYYALHTVARLQPKERVLIHAATGGVGQAAIAWAQHRGAEIYTTAGSPQKREMLRGLGVHYVGDSRSSDFVGQIQELTGGAGVDVVLNSLASPLLEASLEVLGDHGRLVEIGLRDALADHPLGLRPFARNLSYTLVDLSRMARLQPQKLRGIWEEVMEQFRCGALRPLVVHTHPISQTAEALAQMARGQHTGKLAVCLDDPEARVMGLPIRGDACYLVTGGLSGLGLETARWLVRQGAGEVLLMSRREGPDPGLPGARVAVGDVADAQAVARVLASARLPLRGIIHSAAVLDDGLLPDLTSERFEKVFAPKISGAWNLHQQSLASELDLFVMYSSVAGLFGSPGQGNYAAANAYLDELAWHRRGLGLPALSVNWGAFSTGLASEAGQRLAGLGFDAMRPEQGLAWLGRLLGGTSTQIAVTAADPARWIASAPGIAAIPRFGDLIDPQAGAEGQRSLGDLLRHHLAQVLRMDPDSLAPTTPFADLGIDSLMALEFRNRVESHLGGRRMPASALWTHPHLEALAAALGGASHGESEGASLTALGKASTTVSDGERRQALDGTSPTVVSGPPSTTAAGDESAVAKPAEEGRAGNGSPLPQLSDGSPSPRRYPERPTQGGFGAGQLWGDLEMFSWGQGRALLLLPPVSYGVEIWRHQIEPLVQTGRRVLTLHYPGYGLSPQASPSLAPPSLARAILRALDEQDVQEFDLVGWSLGGLIAQSLALLAGPRARTLALVATSARLRAEGFTRPLDLGPPVQDTMVSLQLLDAALSWDGRPFLGQLGLPTLIVQGALDRLTPPDQGRVLRDGIASASYVEVPSGDHFLPWHLPSEFNEILLSFLKTHEQEVIAT